MRAAIVALAMVGCGSPTDRKAPDKYEFDLRLGQHARDPGRFAQAPQQLVKPEVPAPAPPPPVVKPKLDPSCVGSGTVEHIRWQDDKLIACLDTTGDGTADACAGWRRATGKFLAVEPIFAVEDTKPAGKPHTVYLHAIPSGATLARFTIPATGEDGSTALVPMEHGMLGVTQWKTDTGNNDNHLRIEVLDPRAGSSRAFTAPRC